MMMINSNHKVQKHSLIVYLLLANGITWLCWIPGLVIGMQQGYLIPNFASYAALFGQLYAFVG